MRWVAVLFALLVYVPFASFAAAPGAGAVPAELATVLNSDGTLQAGTNGSFNARGYCLSTAPDGRPVFRPLSPTGADDQYWQDGFFLPGIGGIVNAIVARGSEVYVGGTFQLAWNVPATNVARWDGTMWHPLGNGANMQVYALLLDGADLYAGGEETVNFSNFGSVARWNGSTWTTLGASMGSGVTSLAMTANGSLFAGRYSISGSGMVTQWNGTTWNMVGNGQLNGGVRALAVNGADLYVGGDFTQANGVSANYIAKWNGSAWSALGTGLDNSVWALAFHGTDLYVGGRFYTAGTTPARNIARWDGSGWNALGAGITSLNGTVQAIAFSGNDLYVCGQFGAAGGAPANCAAKWDGASWSDLGAGPSYAFRALALVGSDLYLGGQFDKVGDTGATGIAKRSAGTWGALGTGLNNFVFALAVHGNNIYVAGNFIKAGAIVARYIAKWDGTAWSSLGTGAANGMNNPVNALAVAANGDLYAGGSFTQAGGAAASYVAKWNGTTWSALATGVNSPVQALALASNGDLYAGGSFTQAGSIAANYVAKWNGNAWSPLGSGVAGRTGPGQFVYVSLLAVRGSEVYVGGNNFSSAGGVPVNQLARWNGTTWSDMGFLGSSSYISAIAASGSDLYVAGSFTAIGAVASNGFAKWDGTSWKNVGPALGNPITALTVRGTDVYAGGRRFAVGTSFTSLARWDGTAWTAFGSPLAGDIAALAVAGTGDVATGGTFGGTADLARTSCYFGVYRTSLITAAGTPRPTSGQTLFPNPARQTTTLCLPAAAEPRPVWLTDALGREVLRQVFPARATSASLDLRGLPPGMYLMRCGSYSTRIAVE